MKQLHGVGYNMPMDHTGGDDYDDVGDSYVLEDDENENEIDANMYDDYNEPHQ